MQIARYASETDRNPVIEDLSWEQLVQMLTTHRRTPCAPCPGKDCPHKRGEAWGPYLLDPCPEKCRRLGQRSDCGGGKLHRLNENVRETTLAVFDLDHVSMASASELLAKVEAAGLAFIAHSSHSHREDDACLRLVVLLSRPLGNHERLVFRTAVEARFGFRADPATKDPSRLYYLPSAPESAPVFTRTAEGAALDVDGHLRGASMPPGPRGAKAPVQAVAKSAPEDLEALRHLLRQMQKPESRALAEKILVGESLAEVGERNTVLNRACSLLVWTLPEGTSTEAILELLHPSLKAMPAGQDGEPENWGKTAEGMIERARGRRNQAVADEAEWSRALRAGMAAESALADGAARDDVKAVYEDVEESGGPPYTDEELARWAKEQGTTIDGFRKRWIIQHNKDYYVFVGGRYRSSITRDSFFTSITRDLARAPVSLWDTDNKGNRRDLSMRTILEQHGTAARHIHASVSLQRSYYDPRTETFFEAVRPLRPIRAREHPEIQRWLELLGGDERERLLDWVATVTRLDRQTCAIYLHGAPGSGKSLLAHGLARLWSTSGPAELQRVLLSNFNDAILTCPLLFADESLPQRKGITSELRSLIGSSARQLSQKYLAAGHVTGAVRVILAGNNDRLLDSPEDLSGDDLDAIAGRFLYIRPDPKTATYLDELGAAASLDSWKADDLIAEHATFLAQTRKVRDHGRFLVQGQVRAFHEHLAVGSGLGAEICDWLAKYLSDGATALPSCPTANLILVGNGQVWANAEALSRKAEWERRVPYAPVPSTARVSRTLSNLSNGSERLRVGDKQFRYHKVRVHQLLQWAEENLAVDVGDLRARIDRRNEVLERSLARLAV